MAQNVIVTKCVLSVRWNLVWNNLSHIVYDFKFLCHLCAVFFTEVVDSLTRGYDDKLHPDNLILEINSSRYAYNVSVREVSYFVMKALLSLPIQARSVDSTPKYLMEFNKVLRDFLPILQNYVRNSDSQHDCLQALEVCLGIYC
jgi:hypothetical protein